ncbi:hypothetical protein RFI_15914 [Reticulomyxa filosa]|uniref:Uncharacterized protein n=1 Tax=Reticulomyxa filosa TaxID=46433 RepID=X6N5T2_RETFI|nr:hypothetical protein RFI_15914 [Reticulomyxa filosa]|eukprot:ETO21288.1 hypothetical protein RFI_15914 [Reticulomyxa filosa]
MYVTVDNELYVCGCNKNNELGINNWNKKYVFLAKPMKQPHLAKMNIKTQMVSQGLAATHALIVTGLFIYLYHISFLLLLLLLLLPSFASGDNSKGQAGLGHRKPLQKFKRVKYFDAKTKITYVSAGYGFSAFVDGKKKKKSCPCIKQSTFPFSSLSPLVDWLV